MIALSLLLFAQSYRLSGDTLVLARAPAGIIALGGDAQLSEWGSAQALIWAGTGDVAEADALIAAVELRHPSGYAELSLGRMIAAGGALRAVHLDGARAVLRAPFGTSAEAFGGVPVGPRFVGRGGDWLAGGRLSQNVLGWGAVGISVYEERDRGDLAHREVGLDLALFPIEWADLSARAAYDLLDGGISEVLLNGGVTFGIVRGELFATHRQPARILPATSIFSVLGDVPATRAGARVAIAVAPRLDVSVEGGARQVDGWGEELALRTTLRLDDRGRGALGLELRRDGAPGGAWSGVRALARLPLWWSLVLAAEVELVIPDESRRGALWPWGLLALGWGPVMGWELSAAVEANASPELRFAIDGLFLASYRWASP